MPENPLTQDDKHTLLALARRSIEAFLLGQSRPLVEASGMLAEPRGCFITLTNRGELRGCIGTFQPQGPLAEQVAQMAQAAARDPRFTMNPVTRDELPDLTIQVSVLSPLEKTEQPEQLEIGRHGIYIMHGGQSGCFLPEVATDQGWGVEEFLSYCCAHKAGLPADAWKQPGTDVYLFTSEKFSE
jgi:AmmeMemoRadiSam system protein A